MYPLNRFFFFLQTKGQKKFNKHEKQLTNVSNKTCIIKAIIMKLGVISFDLSLAFCDHCRKIKKYLLMLMSDAWFCLKYF